MSEYNLHTIREMLGEAFSSGEITTLAFDLFQDVYQDFAAGMTRSQKIELVVTAANSRGRIPDLLDYVQRHNGYQYDRFADQLISETQGPSSDSATQKKSSRRLIREKESLESQANLLGEKIRILRESIAIDSDVSRKFQNQKLLESAESELNEIEDKLDEIDSQL